MAIRMLAAVVAGSLCAFAADGLSTQRVKTETTERLEFQADGTLRFNNAIGELTVEGWDSPAVEITTLARRVIASSAAGS